MFRYVTVFALLAGGWAGGPSFAERRVGARFLAGTGFLSLSAHASQR
jgi:hypothetical protein